MHATATPLNRPTSRTRATLARAAIGSALLAFGLLLAQLALASPASAVDWTEQSSGTDAMLWKVSCPTTSTCYAVGDSGTIRKTANGGETWSEQFSGTTQTLLYISCPTTSTCYAVGNGGTSLKTVDGGATWSDQGFGGNALTGISCPTASTCYSVGTTGTAGFIRKTVDGGETWSGQNSSAADPFWAVSCPTASTCYAVGKGGTIRKTADGGATPWSAQDSGTDVDLRDVACPAEEICYVVGFSGTILRTMDGGETWSAQASGTSAHLLGVACPTAATCHAVGAGGTIRATSTGGEVWTGESSGVSDSLRGVSCPSLASCWAVGNAGTIITNSPTATPSGVNSDDCDAAPDTTASDGFVGDTYVKVRTAKPSAQETWVCVQAANATANVGGKFVVESSGAPEEPDVDNNHAQCSTEPGNQVPGPHPIDAKLGDPNDPPHVTVELDSYTDGDRAWVCVFASESGANTSFGRRVVVPFPDAGAVEAVRFEPDTVEADVPDPEKIGFEHASATCQQGEESGTGNYQRVVNSAAGDEHIWLDAWQESDSRGHICVREEGKANLGGRITVDTLGLGVEPVFETDDEDMSPCSTQVFQSDALETEIRRSPTGANPASLCVQQGTTKKRVTIGTEGDLALAVVTWTPDLGTPIPPIP